MKTFSVSILLLVEASAREVEVAGSPFQADRIQDILKNEVPEEVSGFPVVGIIVTEQIEGMEIEASDIEAFEDDHDDDDDDDDETDEYYDNDQYPN